MPSLVASESTRRSPKRHLEDDSAGDIHKRAKTSGTSAATVKELEDAIQDSQKNFNQIAALISIAKSHDQSSTEALVSLCRVFSRLISQERLSKAPNASKNEAMVTDWLRQRYSELKEALSALVESEDSSRHEMGLTLLMQLTRQELENASSSLDSSWRTGIFRTTIRAVLRSIPESEIVALFIEKYFGPHDDVRFYTLTSVSEELDEERDSKLQRGLVRNSMSILSSIKPLPRDEKLNNFFFKPPKSKDSGQKMSFTKPASHRKQAQRAWLVLLSQSLTPEQRKHVLQIMTKAIVPLFMDPIRLMDFLTDSFNEGGPMALLALSGMFEMMTTCNLDYPLFYNKLYALLDDDILHSSYRSRFFRLLNEFLNSTHVPAAMIASFIKKLARLALHAPPAAIVAVIPLTYNLLYEHRACTFMIHRESRTEEERQLIELEGAEDPFDPNEPDPMETGAIDSSLWELVALQNHYHPNVSSLAGIISQQFTKPSYSLEDFLDHSYTGLVAAELRKEVRKPPVVEFEIPKRIFIDGEDMSLESMMEEAMKES